MTFESKPSLNPLTHGKKFDDNSHLLGKGNMELFSQSEFQMKNQDQQSMTDELLWTALKNGKQAALKEIYNDHIESLLQYGCRFSVAKELVEDCIHDLFIYLWQNRSSIGHTDSIKSYLLVSLRRRIIRQLKKESVVDSNEPVSFEAGLSMEDRWIQAEENSEKQEALHQAFSALSDRQKEAIYLRYFHKMNYEVISKIMAINNQSVRNLIYNGIQCMRKMMVQAAFIIFLILA